MGLLSNLFGVSEKQCGSYVRAWAERRDRELSTYNDLSPETLFADVMYGLSTSFDKVDTKFLGIDASKIFSGDAALFELGCYMWFRIDLWLFQNRPEQRQEISTTFAREFIKLFSEAFNSNTVPTIFKHRGSGFEQLARSGADAEQHLHHLSHLIFRSKSKRHPEEYDFETAPITLEFMGEYVGLMLALTSWGAAMFPTILEGLKEHCDLTA